MIINRGLMSNMWYDVLGIRSIFRHYYYDEVHVNIHVIFKEIWCYTKSKVILDNLRFNNDEPF
jgi:hypothetical protein